MKLVLNSFFFYLSAYEKKTSFSSTSFPMEAIFLFSFFTYYHINLRGFVAYLPLIESSIGSLGQDVPSV